MFGVIGYGLGACRNRIEMNDNLDYAPHDFHLRPSEPSSDSMRFWTGRHVIDDTSVCYRNAAEAVYGGLASETYLPSNPFQVDPD